MELIQVGQVLDKYELLERVGQGGMAVVYLAHDEELHRPVAVKVLAEHLAGDGTFRRRFLQEGQAAARDERRQAAYSRTAQRMPAVHLGPWSARRRCFWQSSCVWARTAAGVTV